MTPMKPPRFGGYGYRRVLVIVSIVTLLLAALVTTTRDDHGSTIATLPEATAQPSIPGGGGSGSGGNGSGPPFPMQPPAMPDAPAPYNGGSYPAPYQGNGIDINNPAEQPAQAPQQQPNSQQTNPQQLQPANGQQPLDYDAPLQTAQPQPQQQPQQQTNQQQPEQQEQQQEQEQEQQPEQQQDDNEKRKCPSFDPDVLDKRDLTAAEKAALKKLRAKTPNDELKKHVAQREGIPNTPDWVVDHIVALRRLVQIPGFIDLPFSDQLAIAEMDANTYPLGPNFNSAKQDRTAEEFGGKVIRTGAEMTQEDFDKLCKKEAEGVPQVLKEAEKRIAALQSSPAPSKPVTQTPSNPPTPSKAQPATKADSIAEYDRPPSTSEIWQRQHDPNYLLSESTKLQNEFNSLEHDISWLNTDGHGNLANADSYIPPADAAKAAQLRALQSDVAKSLTLVNSMLSPSTPTPPAPAPPPPPPPPSFLQRLWNWWTSSPSIPGIPIIGPVPVPVP